MYPDGTKVHAYSDAGHCIEGHLVGDHECLDGIVRIYDKAEGDVVDINGWLWSIETQAE
jgi:hypothetical protein